MSFTSYYLFSLGGDSASEQLTDVSDISDACLVFLASGFSALNTWKGEAKGNQ